MPPKTRYTSANRPSKCPRGPSVPSSYLWPNKVEGQPVDTNDPLLLDYNCEGWDKASAAKYNRLLAAEILPPRFAHSDTLAALGDDTNVFDTLQAMGIASLCYQTHVLYPDLVRQVLAIAQI